MPTPPRLLVIAYSCAPRRGSEWGISWNFVREIARAQPLTLITHGENRADLAGHLKEHPTEHPIHVEFVTLPKWVNWFGSLCYSFFNIQYYLWQHAAARAARRLHAAAAFDVVQHVSLVRWWMPTAAATLATQGVPFIFGPVGGGEPMPRRFRSGIGLMARLSEIVRGVAVGLWTFDPMLKRSIRRASLVLASTPHAARRIAAFQPRRLETMSAAVTSAPTIIEAARAHRVQTVSAATPSRPFRMVSSGGLSYYRGVDLALRAFAKAALPNAEYIHTSDGPERARLETLAHSLGIADRVKFLGDHPHAENVKTVATADMYVHTVLRDSMGLIPDAMVLGIPVLTLDHNSMALLIDATSGHKVRLDDDATPEAVVDELARVMTQWHGDAALRERLGAGAMARGERFTPAGRAKIFRELHAALAASASATHETPPPLSAGPLASVRGEG